MAHNLNFGYSVANEERKHLITLWNTYSFFITYARLDGFNPGEIEVTIDQRSKLDRWILAKVNLLAKSAKECVESFYLEKKTYQEISNIFSLELKKVKSYIQNGKRNLKTCIENKIGS